MSINALALSCGVAAAWLVPSHHRDSAGSGESPLPAIADFAVLQDPPKEAPKADDPKYVLGCTAKSIDGKDVELSVYKGKVVLIVNVASKCGYTPQYEGLEALYKARKDQGLVILGFPANNFGSQEPGTNEEIVQFCSSKYSVTFPLFAKISVKGDDQHALFKRLANQPAPVGGDPKWNFTKFLVDRNGRVVARFEPKVKPDDKALIAAIDELLKPSGDKKPEGHTPTVPPKPGS